MTALAILLLGAGVVLVWAGITGGNIADELKAALGVSK